MKISDHAFVRFLERVCGKDVETTRTNLAASLSSAAEAAATLGMRRFTVLADGMKYIVADGVLVTVVPDGPAERAPRPLRERDEP
ncbi:hypothetical protein [Chelatococcus sp.]|uniref:hypothetical protein n=1 Tax=Chelatococcus sp. TaxID=1953771 RepID=UPI0025C334A0|nr:hypothetical protein [Chelatococcus sp.]